MGLAECFRPRGAPGLASGLRRRFAVASVWAWFPILGYGTPLPESQPAHRVPRGEGAASLADLSRSVRRGGFQDLYVDRENSSARDTHAGNRSELPLATVSAALRTAFAAQDRGENTRVIVAPGTYRESLPSPRPARAPAERVEPVGQVIIEAEVPGTAVISGSDIWDTWVPDPLEFIRSRSNLVRWSSALEQAPWRAQALSVQPDAALDPLGNFTADRLEMLGSGSHSLSQPISTLPGKTYTFSAYVRPQGISRVRLDALVDGRQGPGIDAALPPDPDWGGPFPTFIRNFTQGGVEAVDGGWFRVYFCARAPADGSFDLVRLYLMGGASDSDAADGSGAALDAWGFQVEGGVDGYLRTEETPIETPRKNLVRWSEGLERVPWEHQGMEVSANHARSPDGPLGAERLEASGDGFHWIFQDVITDPNRPFDYSVYLRPREISKVRIDVLTSERRQGPAFDVHLSDDPDSTFGGA